MSEDQPKIDFSKLVGQQAIIHTGGVFPPLEGKITKDQEGGLDLRTKEGIIYWIGSGSGVNAIQPSLEGFVEPN